MLKHAPWVGLGEDVYAGGHISPGHLERAVDAAPLVQRVREGGAACVLLVATDAVRDTANADDLVAAVRGRTGIELQLVDGEREAQLAYRGAAVGEDACGCATWEAATPRRFAPKKDAVCFAEI